MASERAGDVAGEPGSAPLDIDSLLVLLQVEQEQIQKRTFTNWVNAQLAKRRPPCRVEDLFDDFRDGSKLLDLLEVMSDQSISRERGRGTFQHRSNIEKALAFLRHKSIKLVNINVPDIIDGKPSIILGLVWTIILQYHIEELASGLSFGSRQSSMESLASLDSRSSRSARSPVPRGGSPLHARFRLSAKKALMLWVREQCRKAGCSAKVKDFKGSWRSGVLFLAILHALRSDLVDLSKAAGRSNRQNLDEAFRVAERELRIPRLLEPDDVDVREPDEKSIMTYVAQFLRYSKDAPVSGEDAAQSWYLNPPKAASPISLPVHYTPAISASPLRQSTPEHKAQEVSRWLLQAYEELLEGWESTRGESYSERYHVFQTFVASFSEQRRPIMPMLTAMRRSCTLSEEQRGLREAWDALTQKLAEYQLELDVSLPEPLDAVARWLRRAEGVLAEEEAEPRDHGRAADQAGEKREQLKVCLEEMPQQVKSFQSFQNQDEYGNLLVPTEKMEDLKRRLTGVRVSAKYHGIKLEYRQHRHMVLDLLTQIRSKVRSWSRPYLSPEALKLLLHDCQELVTKQELPSNLEAALHKLKQVSEKYSSKSALAADYPHVCQQVTQLEEDTATVLAEVNSANDALGQALSAWDSYSDALSSMQAWLEQASAGRACGSAPRVTSETLVEWDSRRAHLNQVANFLMESAHPQTSRSLEEELLKLNLDWAEFVQRNTLDCATESNDDIRTKVPDLQTLVKEATLLLQEPVQTTSGLLRTFRKRIQIVLRKLNEVDLEALDSSPECSVDQLEKQKGAMPEQVKKTLCEADRVCAAFQQSISALDGRLAELLHWECEARELCGLLRATERLRQQQRGQDPRARVLISRGLQLEGQVVTEEQDLQALIMTHQKSSPIQHLQTTVMQDRVRAALAQSQEAVGMLSSLGARRDRSRSPTEGPISKVFLQAESTPHQLWQSDETPPNQESRGSSMELYPCQEIFVPNIVVQEYEKGKMSLRQHSSAQEIPAAACQAHSEHWQTKEGTMMPQQLNRGTAQLEPTCLQPQEEQQEKGEPKKREQEVQPADVKEYQVGQDELTNVVEVEIKQPHKILTHGLTSSGKTPVPSQELQRKKAQAVKNRPWLQNTEEQNMANPCKDYFQEPSQAAQPQAGQDRVACIQEGGHQTETPGVHPKFRDCSAGKAIQQKEGAQLIPNQQAKLQAVEVTHHEENLEKKPNTDDEQSQPPAPILLQSRVRLQAPAHGQVVAQGPAWAQVRSWPPTLGANQPPVPSHIELCSPTQSQAPVRPAPLKPPAQSQPRASQQTTSQTTGRPRPSTPEQNAQTALRAQSHAHSATQPCTSSAPRTHIKAHSLSRAPSQDKPEALVKVQADAGPRSQLESQAQKILPHQAHPHLKSQTQVPQPTSAVQAQTQPQVQAQPQMYAHPMALRSQSKADATAMLPSHPPLKAQSQMYTHMHTETRSQNKTQTMAQIQSPAQPKTNSSMHLQLQLASQVHCQPATQSQGKHQPSPTRSSGQGLPVVQPQVHPGYGESQPGVQYPGQLHAWTQVCNSSSMPMQLQVSAQAQAQAPSQVWNFTQELQKKDIQQGHGIPQAFPQPLLQAPQEAQWAQSAHPQMHPTGHLGHPAMSQMYAQPQMLPQSPIQVQAHALPPMRPQVQARPLALIPTQEGHAQQQMRMQAPHLAQTRPLLQAQHSLPAQHQLQTLRQPRPDIHAQLLPQLNQASLLRLAQPQLQAPQPRPLIRTPADVQSQLQQSSFEPQLEQPPPQFRQPAQTPNQPQAPSMPAFPPPPKPPPTMWSSTQQKNHSLLQSEPEPQVGQQLQIRPSAPPHKPGTLGASQPKLQLPTLPEVSTPPQYMPERVATEPYPPVKAPLLPQTKPEHQLAPQPKVPTLIQGSALSGSKPSPIPQPPPMTSQQPITPAASSLSHFQPQIQTEPQLDSQLPAQATPRLNLLPQSQLQTQPQAQYKERQPVAALKSSVCVLPQSQAESPDLCVAPPALAQASLQAYSEAYAKAQALARNGFEEAKHCLQEHILEAISDKCLPVEQAAETNTLRTLDPELLEEFLRAAKGMEAFCTPSQLRDMDLFTQSVRSHWEVCFSTEGDLAQAGQQVVALKGLCDMLSPEDAHRLAHTQLRECESSLAAIQRQFSGDPEASPPDSRLSDALDVEQTPSVETALLDNPQLPSGVSQMKLKTTNAEHMIQHQPSVDEDGNKRETLEKHENYKMSLQLQLSKNEQSIRDVPADCVTLKGLHTRLQEIQFLRQDTESLWCEFANQCSQLSGDAGLEEEKADLQKQWQTQLSSLQRRGSSLAAALRQIDSTENHMVDFTDRLDRYLRQPKDVTDFALADTNILKDIKELDENIQSELDQLARLEPESSNLDPRDCLPLSREVEAHRSGLDQLRQQVRKSEAAARALDRFLMSLRTVKDDIAGVQGSPCGDATLLQVCRDKLAQIRQSVDSLKDKAPQLDLLLQGARLTLTRDGRHASCLDMVGILQNKLEEAEGGLMGQQQSPKRETQGQSLGLRKRTLLGEVRKLQDAVESRGLTEATVPAIQHRLRSLSDLEDQLHTLDSEIQALRELPKCQGEGQKLLEELETEYTQTLMSLSDRKQQCSVLIELLKKFQSRRGHLSSTVLRAEQTINEQASYMGRDNLHRIITKVEDNKKELSSLSEQMDEMRAVCRQLQSHLKKFPDCKEAPFEAEADALMDTWLDVTEKMDAYMDNLQVGLELWDKELMLGGEIDGWAACKLASFAEGHPFHNRQQVLAMKDEIQAYEDNIQRFHKKSEEIQEMLQSQEAPLELQVMETQLRKRMEQVKELYADCTDVFEELMVVKKHLAEKIAECLSAVERIRRSADDIQVSEPKVESQLQHLCDNLEAQEDQVELVLREMALVSNVASPQVLEELTADCGQLADAVAYIKHVIHLKREEKDKGLFKVIQDERHSFEDWFQDLQLAVNECFENPETRADVERALQRLAEFVTADDSERRLERLREHVERRRLQMAPQQLCELSDWLTEQQEEARTLKAHCLNRQEQMENLGRDLSSLQTQHDALREWLRGKEEESATPGAAKQLLRDLRHHRADMLSELLDSVRRRGVRADPILKDVDEVLRRCGDLEARLQTWAEEGEVMEGQLDRFASQAQLFQTWVKDLLVSFTSACGDLPYKERSFKAEAILNAKPEGDSKMKGLQLHSESLCQLERLDPNRKREVQQQIRDLEDEWRSVLRSAEELLRKAEMRARFDQQVEALKGQSEHLQAWIDQLEGNLQSQQTLQDALLSKADMQSKLQHLKEQGRDLCEQPGLDDGLRQEIRELTSGTDERWENGVKAAEEAQRQASAEREAAAFRARVHATLSWIGEHRCKLLSLGTCASLQERLQVTQAVFSCRHEGRHKVAELQREAERLRASGKAEAVRSAEDVEQQWTSLLQMCAEAQRRSLADDFDAQTQKTRAWLREREQQLRSAAIPMPPQDQRRIAQDVLWLKPDGDRLLNDLRSRGQTLFDRQDVAEEQKCHIQQAVKDAEEDWRKVVQGALQLEEEAATAQMNQEAESRDSELREFQSLRQETGRWLSDLQHQLDSLSSRGTAQERLLAMQAIVSAEADGDKKLRELKTRSGGLRAQELEQPSELELQKPLQEAEEHWGRILRAAKAALQAVEKQTTLERQLKEHEEARDQVRDWLEDKRRRLHSLLLDKDPEVIIKGAQAVLCSKPEGDSKLAELHKQSGALCDAAGPVSQRAIRALEELWGALLRDAEDSLNRAEAIYSLSRELRAFRGQADGVESWLDELQTQLDHVGTDTRGSRAQLEERLNTAHMILSAKSGGESRLTDLQRRTQRLCEQNDLEEDSRLDVQTRVKKLQEQWGAVLKTAEDRSRQLQHVEDLLVSCEYQRVQAEARLAEVRMQTSNLPCAFPWPGLGERRQASEQARSLRDRALALGPFLSQLRTQAAELFETTQDPSWADSTCGGMEESVVVVLKELTVSVASLEEGIAAERQVAQLLEQHQAAQDWLREQVKGLEAPPDDRPRLHGAVNTLKALLQTIRREQKEMKELDAARDCLLGRCTPGGFDALTLAVSHLGELCATSECDVMERLRACQARLQELDQQAAQRTKELKERAAALLWELNSVDQALGYVPPQDGVHPLRRHWRDLRNGEKLLEELRVRIDALKQEVAAAGELPPEISIMLESLRQQHDSTLSRLRQHQESCSTNTAGCLKHSLRALQAWMQSKPCQSSASLQETADEGEKLQAVLREAFGHQQFLGDCLSQEVLNQISKDISNTLREAETLQMSLRQILKSHSVRTEPETEGQPADVVDVQPEEPKTTLVAPLRKNKESADKNPNISPTDISTAGLPCANDSLIAQAAEFVTGIIECAIKDVDLQSNNTPLKSEVRQILSEDSEDVAVKKGRMSPLSKSKSVKFSTQLPKREEAIAAKEESHLEADDDKAHSVWEDISENSECVEASFDTGNTESPARDVDLLLEQPQLKLAQKEEPTTAKEEDSDLGAKEESCQTQQELPVCEEARKDTRSVEATLVAEFITELIESAMKNVDLPPQKDKLISSASLVATGVPEVLGVEKGKISPPKRESLSPKVPEKDKPAVSKGERDLQPFEGKTQDLDDENRICEEARRDSGSAEASPVAEFVAGIVESALKNVHVISQKDPPGSQNRNISSAPGVPKVAFAVEGELLPPKRNSKAVKLHSTEVALSKQKSVASSNQTRETITTPQPPKRKSKISPTSPGILKKGPPRTKEEPDRFQFSNVGFAEGIFEEDKGKDLEVTAKGESVSPATPKLLTRKRSKKHDASSISTEPDVAIAKGFGPDSGAGPTAAVLEDGKLSPPKRKSKSLKAPPGAQRGEDRSAPKEARPVETASVAAEERTPENVQAKFAALVQTQPALAQSVTGMTFIEQTVTPTQTVIELELLESTRESPEEAKDHKVLLDVTADDNNADLERGSVFFDGIRRSTAPDTLQVKIQKEVEDPHYSALSSTARKDEPPGVLATLWPNATEMIEIVLSDKAEEKTCQMETVATFLEITQDGQSKTEEHGASVSTEASQETPTTIHVGPDVHLLHVEIRTHQNETKTQLQTGTNESGKPAEDRLTVEKADTSTERHWAGAQSDAGKPDSVALTPGQPNVAEKDKAELHYNNIPPALVKTVLERPKEDIHQVHHSSHDRLLCPTILLEQEQIQMLVALEEPRHESPVQTADIKLIESSIERLAEESPERLTEAPSQPDALSEAQTEEQKNNTTKDNLKNRTSAPKEPVQIFGFEAQDAPHTAASEMQEASVERSQMTDIFAELEAITDTELFKAETCEDCLAELMNSASSDLDRLLCRLVSKLLSCRSHSAELQLAAMTQQVKEAQECGDAIQAQAAQLCRPREAEAGESDALEYVTERWHVASQDVAAVVRSKINQLQVVQDFCHRSDRAKTTLERLAVELDASRLSPVESCHKEVERLNSIKRALEENRTVLGELLGAHTKLCPLLSRAHQAAATNMLETQRREWRQVESAVENALHHAHVQSHNCSSLLLELSFLRGHVESISQQVEGPKGSMQDCAKAKQLTMAHAEVKAAHVKYLHMKEASEALPSSLWPQERVEIKKALLNVKDQLCLTEEWMSSEIQKSSNPVMKKVLGLGKDGLSWAQQMASCIEGKRHRVPVLPEEVHQQLRALKKLQSQVTVKQRQLESQVKAATELLPQLDQSEEMPLIRSLLEYLEERSNSVAEMLSKAVKDVESGLQVREKLWEQIADLDSWVETYLQREILESIGTEPASAAELEIQQTLVEVEKQSAACEALFMKSKDIASELSVTENCQLFDKLSGLQEDIRNVADHVRAKRDEIDSHVRWVDSNRKALSSVEQTLGQMQEELNELSFPITTESLRILDSCKHMLMEQESKIGLLESWSQEEKMSELYSVAAKIDNKLTGLKFKAREHQKYLNMRQNVEDLKEVVREQLTQTQEELQVQKQYKIYQQLLFHVPLIRRLCEEVSSKLQMIAPDLSPAQLRSEQQRLQQNEDSLKNLETKTLGALSVVERSLVRELDPNSERKAVRVFLRDAHQDLQKPALMMPNETWINKEYQKIVYLKQTVESRMRALEVLEHIQGSEEGTGLSDLEDLKNCVLRECDLQMDNISNARTSLRNYIRTVNQALQFLRDFEVSLLPLPALTGVCCEKLEETQDVLASLEDRFQTQLDQLGRVGLHPLLSPLEVERFQESILSQLLVRMSTLKAKGYLQLENLSSCAENERQYTKSHEEISQIVRKAEGSLGCAVSGKLSSLAECAEQLEKLQVAQEDLDTAQKRLQETADWCPVLGCRGRRESAVSAALSRVTKLRLCSQRLTARLKQRTVEWSDISRGVEKASAVLQQVEEELPEPAPLLASTKELLDLQRCWEHYQDQLDYEHRALSALELRVARLLGVPPKSEQAPATPLCQQLRDMHAVYGSIKQRSREGLEWVKLELEEKEKVQEELQVVWVWLTAADSLLSELDPSSSTTELKEIHSQLCVQKALVQRIRERLKSKYLESDVLPTEIHGQFEGVQKTLEQVELKVEEAIEKSGPLHRIGVKLLQTQAGLRSVQEKLEDRSSNVADAKHAQKLVWDELDKWHSYVVALAADVQALESPQEALPLTERLVEVRRLHAQLADRAEQKTTLISKMQAWLEEHQEMINSAKSWMLESQSWLAAPRTYCTAQCLREHAAALQTVLNDSAQIRTTLQGFSSILEQMSQAVEVTDLGEQLAEADRQLAAVQDSFAAPLAQLEHATAEVDMMEGEVRKLESSVAEIKAILRYPEMLPSPKEERLKAVEQQIQSMRGCIADIQKAKLALRLPEKAEKTLTVFRVINQLQTSLLELEKKVPALFIQQLPTRTRQAGGKAWLAPSQAELSSSEETEDDAHNESVHIRIAHIKDDVLQRAGASLRAVERATPEQRRSATAEGTPRGRDSFENEARRETGGQAQEAKAGAGGVLWWLWGAFQGASPEVDSQVEPSEPEESQASQQGSGETDQSFFEDSSPGLDSVGRPVNTSGFGKAAAASQQSCLLC